MKKTYLTLLPAYILIVFCLILGTYLGGRAVTVISENLPTENRKCVVIDAGHGGVDGGAVSCTGVYESQINLEIARKLDDLCHLLGIDTKMIRTTDCSVYTQGNSIASKKVSDLKERVRITNETENAIIVSIHQNKFVQSQYSGAQVFYAPTQDSDILAKTVQDKYTKFLNPASNRKIKKADGVYLMQHINCPGILIECGFLSNPEEEAMLRSNEYQKKISCVIASACSQFLNGQAAS